MATPTLRVAIDDWRSGRSASFKLLSSPDAMQPGSAGLFPRHP